MTTIYPKPYKLINKIQNYEWGAKNEKAFIPHLLGMEVVKDLPYAELWIGAHPKASSEILINGEKISLEKLIDKYPVETLGKHVINKFGNKLPFLLKVLSAANALSIQTHPNKKQAEILHSSDPKNYPDDNHKPEIAIAIDSLSAIAGFRPVSQILSNLRNNPELNEYTDEEIREKLFSIENESELVVLLKNIYSNIMKQASDKEKLTIVIKKIVERISGKRELTPEEFQFLKQHKLYGYDVGLISFFFFNIIELKPAQAIFTDAGIPHAYIEGNIIECMANSDNVVRAGLTSKFKDVNTLLDIIRYDFSEYEIINREQITDEIIYKTSAREFEITGYQKKSDYTQPVKSYDRPSVILIMKGSIKITWEYNGEEKSENFIKGESILIPAFLEQCILLCNEEAEYFVVRIP